MKREHIKSESYIDWLKSLILILWLIAAITIIVLMSAKWSARTHPVAPTMQWQADSSWVKSWNYIKNVAE